MSECGVCLTSDYDNCDGMIDDVSIVKLATDQRCCECRKLISAGEDIEQADWYRDFEDEADADSGKESIYTCLVCAEIGDAFYCDGRMYGGGMWDALYEVFGAVNQSCFDRLKTSQAKAELQRRWMDWKGL